MKKRQRVKFRRKQLQVVVRFAQPLPSSDYLLWVEPRKSKRRVSVLAKGPTGFVLTRKPSRVESLWVRWWVLPGGFGP